MSTGMATAANPAAQVPTESEAARAKGDWVRLEKATRKRAALEEATYGPDAAVTAVSWSWIGQALVRRGRDADAEPWFRKALAADRKALGPTHPETLVAISNLAALLERRSRFTDAEPLRAELYAASRVQFGDRSAEAAAGSCCQSGSLLRIAASVSGTSSPWKARMPVSIS